jgi:peptidoglycan/xylan/chitin deacetylase (PgdA/CDA1 family)
MRFYLKTTKLIRFFFKKELIWDFAVDNKRIYLTFDDGPTPGVTNKVLDLLDLFKAKATFFCTGENVKNNPSLYKMIIDRNHAVGNHTQTHLNGRQVSDQKYFYDIKLAKKHIKSTLFRPPYGRITRSQIKHLKNNYKIVMWSVLSGDFDEHISKEKCWKNVLSNTKEGSIIVFHDSLKTANKMLFSLEKTLGYFKEKGYQFNAIPE